MKSVPVAIFSVLFYILIRADIIPILIAFFMIMPIIWQNLMNGYDSIDKNLSEVCLAYEFSYKKKLAVLIFPTLVKYFIPALITSVGFAWKAVISSEILVRTTDSIGKIISDLRFNMDTASVFAWTFIALLLSISLEKGTRYLLGRCKIWD
jgi:NitT/TauT family transport system permease protein